MTKPPRGPREIKRAADTKAATVQSRPVAPGRDPAGQRDLFEPRKGSAPLLSFVKPCLATLVEKVPTGDRWLHEIKWDGYRLMIRIERGEVSLLTRRGHDWTDRFPTIREAAKALRVDTALIDGEAVVEVGGIPNFSALQAALGAREGPGHKAAHEAVFYAFDLLHLDGADLGGTPLVERKQALAPLVERPRRSASLSI